jgi:hypothetical protein
MSTSRISRLPRRVRERHRTILLPLAVSVIALGLFASCSDADRVSGLAELGAMGPLRLNAVADSVEVTWDPVKNAADYAYSWGAAEQAGLGVVEETRVVLPLSVVPDTRAELPLADGDWVCVWSRNDAGESADSSCATYQAASSGGRYPNEPAGFVPWFEHDWQTWPQTLRVFHPASGAGYIYSRSSNFELINDPDAPHGRGMSLRHRQPKGQPSGSTGGVFDIYSIPNRAKNSADHVLLKSVYRSHWVMFEPDPRTGDWQYGDTHMRTFWWNRDWGDAGFRISIRSPSTNATARSATFRGLGGWFYPTSDTSPSTSKVWTDSEHVYQVGRWYHFESLVETEGKFGSDDSGINRTRIRMWVDGVLKLDETRDVHFSYPLGNEHFGMVWLGGSMTERLQDDFVRFGDIYISGVSYQDN